MKGVSRGLWSFLGVLFLCSAVRDAKKTDKADAFTSSTTTTDIPDSTESLVLPEELMELFSFSDDSTSPQTNPKIPVAATLSSTESSTRTGELSSENVPESGSSKSTTQGSPTLNDLLSILQNFTTVPVSSEENKQNDVLENVTTIAELTQVMADKRLNEIQDLSAMTNSSLIQKLVNATEQANITTLGQLRNLSEAMGVENLEDAINYLHNVSAQETLVPENITVANSSESSANGTDFNTVGHFSSATTNISVTTSAGNMSEPIQETSATDFVPESTETEQYVTDEQGLWSSDTTTEISRLETVTNDESWKTTENAAVDTSSYASTTNEPLSTWPTTSSLADEISSDEISPDENVTVPPVGLLNRNDDQFGGLVTALVFGCLLVLILIIFAGKRLYDGYQRRHYTKMDYLVNGMYN